MPELIIKRKKQFFAPANCCFRVYIDEIKKTTLSNGENDRFNIPSGEHTIQIRNNYFTSRKKNFIISDQQNISIETYSRTIIGWLYVIAPIVLLVFTFLRLIRVPMPLIVAILALAPFALFVVLALVLGLTKNVIVIRNQNNTKHSL